MKTGLLWYDGDPKRSLEDKIERAAGCYHEKYGRWPNTCYVNPQAVSGESGEGSGTACQPENCKSAIRILSAPNILLHHFWLGENGDKVAARRRKAAS
jgi:hypothetical protein